MSITKSWILENEIGVKRKCCSCGEKMQKHSGKLDGRKRFYSYPSNEQVNLADFFSYHLCKSSEKDCGMNSVQCLNTH